MEITTLFKNKWLSFREMKSPKDGIHGYSFIHEDRCNGKIVSILPFRQVIKGKLEFYIRQEVTPCWNMEQNLSSVTGGVENDDVAETTIHEIREEAGYECEDKEIIKLGTCFGAKCMDTVYYLSAVDVTEKKVFEAKGDGSELEAKASMVWMDEKDIYKAVDPLVGIIYLRLKNYLDEVS